MLALCNNTVNKNKILIILFMNIVTILFVGIFATNLSYTVLFLILYVLMLSCVQNDFKISLLLPLFSLFVGFDYLLSLGIPYGFADEVTFYKVVFFYLQPTELNNYEDGFGFFNLIGQHIFHY